MDDFKLDARRWRFLDNPARYLERETGGLLLEPLRRQFATAKEILVRMSAGRGVLLADDVGLGKTTVGALVAWVLACQDKRVRIYAPNEVLRRRWAEELERHIPMLRQYGASKERIKPGDVGKLNAGRIQVATHHALVQSRRNNEQRTACDLMIIDEAHRAKGDGSAFNDAMRSLGDRARRKLILTATPFSINITELEQLLTFVGADGLRAVRRYASDLARLYKLGNGHDVQAESARLVTAARVAIDELRPWVIRNGIDDLSPSESKHFGSIAAERWEIATAAATSEELALLLRMDRLLHLTVERRGERRNDPRFHIGWRHVATALDRAIARAEHPIVRRHGGAAITALKERRAAPHPKIAAVSNAIRPIVDAGEKVLVFCHHRATAAELLLELEGALKVEPARDMAPPVRVWREAWEGMLGDGDELMEPILDWLCSPGVCAQVSRWLGKPALAVGRLQGQLSATRPRGAAAPVPSIAEAARSLRDELLDEQSTSTRAVLRAIARNTRAFGQGESQWPGHMDDGHRVMGTWKEDEGERPTTLYTGQPDIVLALFNSPFGPDVLVTTDWLSEGVDLHRCCRHLIHYELDPSPIRTLQRNGRLRRVNSWAAQTRQPIRYAYPTFGGTRDEKAVGVMRQRINAFGLLLGGVPRLDDEDVVDEREAFAEQVLRVARRRLESLNQRLSG
ncbi:MAG: DEAD/DEAH box helicase family protein [Gemmatimonadetes bacterium]|nr:DEAD/DEAH box helicase family protein [Gemmatimonadota bacterium]